MSQRHVLMVIFRNSILVCSIVTLFPILCKKIKTAAFLKKTIDTGNGNLLQL